MSNLFKKANAFYFIASSLTLLTSLALIVTSNVPLPLILALAALSYPFRGMARKKKLT